MICGTVVLYNPLENVKDNILSYLDLLDKLYVVDNSVNQDNQYLLPSSNKIVYINNKDNLGIAKALNIAFERAIKDGYTWVLTMDQDSKFLDDNFKKLISSTKVCQNDKVAIITPYQVIKTKIPKPKEKIDYPLEVMTSGNMVRVSAYQKVGGFKDWLFIDCVDIEFCMNLCAHGFLIERHNDILLKHNLGDYKCYHILGHEIQCSNHNYIRRYYMTRNALYIYDMYHEKFSGHCKYIKNGLFYQVRNILFFEKDKYRKLRNMLRGKRDYKRQIKGKYAYKN